MSFIYENPWLLQELLKSAQATPAPAPQTNTTTEEGAKALEYAKQLIKNLYTELAGKFTFTAERDNADLSTAHVVNVDELLYFLQFNGVKANGHNLVMKANEFLDQNGKLKPNMTEMAKWYVPYPVQGNPNYYLYKDGMIDFLRDLEEKAANNPMLKAIVAKLKGMLSAALPEKTTPKTDVAGGGDTPSATPQQQGAGDISPQILMQLSSLRPFNSQYISFGEIEKFIDLYVKYANNSTITDMVNNLKGDIKGFQGYLARQSPILDLNNIDNNRFRSLLRNRAEGTPAAELLRDIISYAGQLYRNLIVSMQTLAQDAERAKYIDYRAMQQQVAPGGPQQTNLTTLNSLAQSLTREWMAQK